MLLLPLLILWARAPMKFPRYMKRSLAGLVVLIAVLTPVLMQQRASGAERDMPDNRLRADRQLAAADGNANQMRPKKMREGTRVPQTVGRFVPAGRRWMFVPDTVADKTNDIVAEHPSRRESSTKIFRSVSTNVDQARSHRLGYAGITRADQRNPLREPLAAESTRAPEQQLAMKPDAILPEPDENNPIDLPQVVVAENLMLQRIVEAIRIDGADDRWTISGRLTEYFDENRLQLRTAERAASK